MVLDPPGYPGVVGGGGAGGISVHDTWSVFMVHGQCLWSTWSVFMVHMVSVHGHDDMT